MTSKIMRSGVEMTGIKSVVYTETVNAGSGLRPGCVASASIQVEVFGSQSDAPTSGEALTYYQVDGETETLIGTFYAEPSIPSRRTYRFVAYDAVAKLDASFSERLNAIQDDFPMTVYDIVSEACTVAGVTLSSSSWPLSTQTVQAFYADGITCRHILQYAAEIAGRFARCNSDGEIDFDWYTTNSTYSILPGTAQNGVAYKQDGLSYDNYSVLSVDAVAIRPSGTEGAAYIYPSSYGSITATDPNGDGNVILTNITVTDNGNGNMTLSAEAEDSGGGNLEISSSAAAANTLIIGDNLLLTNATDAIYNAAAENIYNVMSVLPTYRHSTIRLFPGENPFRAGEFVSVTDIQGVSFVTPIFTMTVQADAATLQSSGNESYSADTDTSKELRNLASNLVQIDRLKVSWAEIDTAIINTLIANGIDADWINTGSLTVLDDDDNIIFKADKDNESVQIAGWSADAEYLQSTGTDSSGYTYFLKLGQGNIETSGGNIVPLGFGRSVRPPLGSTILYSGHGIGIFLSNDYDSSTADDYDTGVSIYSGGLLGNLLFQVEDYGGNVEAKLNGNLIIGDSNTSNSLIVNGVDIAGRNQKNIGGAYIGSTTGGASGTTFYLESGVWMILTAHNGGTATVGSWIVSTNDGYATNLAGGTTITMSVSGTALTVTTAGANVTVYGIKLS